MIDLDAPRFMAGAVADAIGVEPTRLNDWLKSGAVCLGKYDVPADAQGSRRLFTLRRAYQLGIMAALAGCGVSPKRAATYAIKFSDVGFGPAIDDYADALLDGSDRAPGELFGDDESYLVAEPGSARAHVVRGRNLKPGWVGVAVHLNPIVERVRRRLLH